jgi:hypothetical protein
LDAAFLDGAFFAAVRCPLIEPLEADLKAGRRAVAGFTFALTVAVEVNVPTAYIGCARFALFRIRTARPDGAALSGLSESSITLPAPGNTRLGTT